VSLRSPLVRRLAPLLVAAAALSTAGCLQLFWRTEARSVARPSAGDTSLTRVRSPVRAHLADGSTVVFRRGGVVGRGRLTGNGESYALLGGAPVPRGDVPLDSIVGLETFEGKVLAAPTVVGSLAATAIGAVAAAGLAIAIFGSCPTVYADTGAGPVLEAEGFSYALAPLLEHRDLDPLRVRAGPDGTVRLDLRNEALETHYINHVAHDAVRHPAGTRVVPDERGQPVALRGLQPLAAATDRAGRDVRAPLAAADGRLFASDPRTVDAARVGDLDDWIDVAADELPPGDSIAVVLRLRNSLLNTVLLYEGMLGGRDGADWLSGGLQHIAGALDLSRWYVRTMGMRATVEGVAPPADARAGLARLGDVGPIAFRDVALVLPRPSRDARSVRVRLRFVADNWRIDQAAVAGTIARPRPATLPVARVVVPTPAAGGGPRPDSAAVSALAEADDRYLETRPGQRMTLVFDAGARRAAGDSATTYLLAWQGWYSEWIRGAWLARPTRTTPFVPGDSAVLAALRSWRAQRPGFEAAFYASRIPVR
jgi:hypothetical protein